jgi:heme-degrading monooxygenase HmoA
MEANQTSERIFIDRFIVPQNSKPEFIERMNINRNFIKTLPGFIEDKVYERIDDQGNLICVTVAVWASEEAIKSAREIVQAEYKKEGFNLPAMLERLNISMVERGVYTRQME